MDCVAFFCAVARYDPELCRLCWLLFFFSLLRAWSSTLYLQASCFSFFLCAYPVMQVHRLRGWRLRSGWGTAGWSFQGWMMLCWLMCWVPSDLQGLNLVRTEHICLRSSEQTCKITHTCAYLAVAWLCHLLILPPLLPAVCTGWWLESGCHWPVRYPL